MSSTIRKRSAVPASRLSRVLRFGLLSGELALATAVGTAKQLGAGRRPDLAAAILTPGTADLLARRLATLRGPAMKLGQILSLHSEELLPESFQTALSMLRSQGYSMPDTQLRRVLGREYGKGWQARFAHFDFEPVAAASIGQLHRARKHGGRELALKIQYPGVARSVDSDVENLATLLRIALRALAVNKLRSALTMLGIIIGVAAVIVMIAVGAGAQARVIWNGPTTFRR